jgi:hypothetical protein
VENALMSLLHDRRITPTAVHLLLRIEAVTFLVV